MSKTTLTLFPVTTYSDNAMKILSHLCQCPAGYGYPIAPQHIRIVREMICDKLIERVAGIGCTILKVTEAGRLLTAEATEKGRI